MKNDNYLTLLEFPTVQFFGFSDLHDSAYINDKADRKLIVIEKNQGENPKNRFQISLNEERQTENETLYKLIQEYDLEKKHFIHDTYMHIYFATDINV